MVPLPMYSKPMPLRSMPDWEEESATKPESTSPLPVAPLSQSREIQPRRPASSAARARKSFTLSSLMLS